MSHQLPSPLPSFDRKLLRAVERFAPAAEREEWRRGWEAELWHAQHRGRACARLTAVLHADLAVGIVCDAVWLRTESWRRTLSGTAVFCLASLLGILLLSTLAGLALSGGWDSMEHSLRVQFAVFLLQAPVVAVVAFAHAWHRYFDHRSPSRRCGWMRRRLFLAVKTTLILLLAFVLSTDFFLPIHTQLPNTADLLQAFLFVLLALLGLRWAFSDQEQRCKSCLRSLATPARVGRPSHNFLEWNGTELICKHGHGLLSVSEMETSWCRSSQWMDRPVGWDGATSVQ